MTCIPVASGTRRQDGPTTTSTRSPLPWTPPFSPRQSPGNWHGVFTPTETEIAGILEELIQKLETVQNDNVDGVPRNLIRLVLNPKTYGQMRQLPRPDGEFQCRRRRRGVRHLPRRPGLLFGPPAVHCRCAHHGRHGAVAQPVVMYPYRAPERIPLSNDMAVAMFYDYGTKALTPDLIFYYKADGSAQRRGGSGGGGD